MEKFIIRIFDKDMKIINQHSYRCYYMEEAETNAKKSCEFLHGYTWDVLWAD
jgi:hypothetical protein